MYAIRSYYADHFDNFCSHFICDDNFHFYLGNAIHDILRATVQLGVSLLATEPFHLRDGDALNVVRSVAGSRPNAASTCASASTTPCAVSATIRVVIGVMSYNFV